VVAWFERWVDDGPIEIVISILIPSAAYFVGDRVHVSGVIAILTVLQVEREALIRLRDERQIDDEVFRTLQPELDLTESRVHTGSLVSH
jgi:NhaP-type Na+/H+ or K+/H+ antiporter